MTTASALADKATPALLMRRLDEQFKLWRYSVEVSRFAKRIAMTPNGRGIVTMPPQYGKRLRADEPVWTPRGWVAHGDLRPGDEVFGPDGQPTRVLAVTGHEQTSTYELELTDGVTIQAHPGHLWTVYDRGGGGWRTVDTEYLASQRVWSGGRARFQLPLVDALQAPTADLPIDPYWLGVWLGDGKSGRARLDLCPADAAEIIAHFEAPSSQGVHATTGVPWFSWRGRSSALRGLGVLNDKHVPERYLLASEDQRRALLAGLVDSDGYVAPDGQVVFVNRCGRLARDVLHLVRTLGYSVGITTRVDDRAEHEIAGNVCDSRGVDHVVYWTPWDGQGQGRLARKQVPTRATRRRLGIRAIRAAEPAVTNCISVDREDGLYLVGETLIPTHNSTICSRATPLWYLDWFPTRRVILASYGAALSRGHGRWIRNTIEENPERLTVRLAPDSKAANQWNTPQGGGLMTAGVGSAMTGFGGDLIVLDDLIKGPAEAMSSTVREGTWDWLLGVTRTRLQPGGSMLVLGTRWHEDDPIGRLHEKQPGRWEELRLPAIAEDEHDPLGRAIGDPLAPGRYPLDEVLALMDELGPYLSAAIMQQRPSPPTGDLFYRDRWDFVDTAPPRLELVRFWDLAATQGGGDRTAGVLVGVNAEGAYVLDVIADRLSGARVKALVEQTAELDAQRYGGKVHTVLEQEPGASGKTLAEEYVNDVLAGYSAEAKGSTGDKQVRATPLASRQQGGHVHIVRTIDGATPVWAPDLIDEAAHFPHGVHDDVVDAMSSAYNEAAARLRARRKKRRHATARTAAGHSKLGD